MARKRTISKEKIINVGLQIIKKEGVEGFNARHLADEIGMTTTPIFTNFGSMENLTIAIWKKAKAECDNYLLKALNHSPVFKEFGMRFLSMAIENQNIFKFVYLMPFSVVSDKEKKEKFAETFKPVFESINTPFNLDQNSKTELVHVLVTFTLGLAVSYIVSKNKPNMDDYSIMSSELFEAVSSHIAKKSEFMSPEGFEKYKNSKL